TCSFLGVDEGTCIGDACVDCTADREGCFAIGWTPMTVPNGLALHAMWAAGVGDAYAVGDAGALLHYDGDSWRTVAAPTAVPLIAIWGSGPTDIFALANTNDMFHSTDGTTWSPSALPAATPNLAALWGADATHVFAVGI